METRIETMPAYEVAYIRHYGAYGESNVETMERLKDWAKSNQLLGEDSIILGIPQDNPEKTKPEDCRYDACLVIAEDYTIHDDDISKGHINKGRYMIFTITHTAEAVQEAYGRIFQEISEQGYEMDFEKPIIERYDAILLNRHQCEICVPLKK